MHRLLVSVLAIGLLWTAGCGTSRPASASASGKVTAGGQPVTGAMISFADPQTGAGAGCDLDAAGAYSIKEGLPPGKYKVSVFPKSAADRPPMPGQTPPPTPESKVPLKYRSDATSGLTADIKPGANPDLDFKLD